MRLLLFVGCVFLSTVQAYHVVDMTKNKCVTILKQCDASSTCCGNTTCINTYFLGDRCLPELPKKVRDYIPSLEMESLSSASGQCASLAQKCDDNNKCCDELKCADTYLFGNRCVPKQEKTEAMAKAVEYLRDVSVSDGKCGKLLRGCNSTDECCDNFHCFDTFFFGGRCFPMNATQPESLIQVEAMADVTRDKDCTIMTGKCETNDQCCGEMKCTDTFFFGNRCLPKNINNTMPQQFQELMSVSAEADKDDCTSLVGKCDNNDQCCGDMKCTDTLMFGNRCFPSQNNATQALAELKEHLIAQLNVEMEPADDSSSSSGSSSSSSSGSDEDKKCEPAANICSKKNKCCRGYACINTFWFSYRCMPVVPVHEYLGSAAIVEEVPEDDEVEARSIPWSTTTPAAPSDNKPAKKCANTAEKCTKSSKCCGKNECWKPIPMLDHGRCMPKFIPLVTRVLDSMNIKPFQNETDFELLYVNTE